MMSNEYKSRRDFLKKSVIGAGATASLAGGLNAFGKNQTGKESQRLPREVWIATVSQHGISAESAGGMRDKILGLMEQMVPLKPDIICLPEVFLYSNIPERPPLDQSAEKPVGEIIRPFAEFARNHQCYVICSTYTEEQGRYYNAAVLLDRSGKSVGEYRKMFPTEGEMKRGITPGPLDPPVFETDFGRIGMQICFDSQWIDGWNKLYESGAEIVFWPSAYAGGSKLNSFATLFSYHVVTSTRKDFSRIIDPTGREIAASGRWEPNWTCAPVNLEKVAIPTWPYYVDFKKMETRYGRDIRITTLHDDEVSIIESLSADLKVSDILAAFQIKPRKEYLESAERMNTRVRNKMI